MSDGVGVLIAVLVIAAIAMIAVLLRTRRVVATLSLTLPIGNLASVHGSVSGLDIGDHGRHRVNIGLDTET